MEEITMIETLCNMIGVSGYEKPIREYLYKQVKDYADSIEVDALGNLIVFKKGYGENKKRIMLCGHMDEVGFQIVKINNDGTCHIRSLGYTWKLMSYMQRVKFENGTIGVIGCMGDETKIQNHTDLLLDIGVDSKEEALKYVKIGDVCTFDTEYKEIQGGYITAKALDDRFACATMAELIQENKPVYNDVYYVFTIQEETGCRGSKVAANYIKPDVGLALDVTPGQDRPCDTIGENAVGKGPAILISDTAIVCHEDVVNALISCCEEANIAYQRSCIYVGGNDGAAISLSNDGIRAGLLGIVIRYCHGPYSMVSKKDIEETKVITEAFTNYEFKF